MADFLIKAGADIELGCSTPLMEAAQEGHLELVKYLLAAGEQEERRLSKAVLHLKCLSYYTFVLTFLIFIIQGQMFTPQQQRVTQR